MRVFWPFRPHDEHLTTARRLAAGGGGDVPADGAAPADSGACADEPDDEELSLIIRIHRPARELAR